jgi:putative transposase
VDADASRRIGAEPYERSVQRQTHRNGYRDRRTERALLSVVQEAYIQGVSTRRMDEVFKAMGLDGITKSEVSRICQELRHRSPGVPGTPLGSSGDLPLA